MRTISRACAVVFCAMVCLAASADQTESPAYKSWAAQKPGTSVTMATTSDAGGQTTKMETKTTLSEVSDDKVVIEMATSMDMNGQKMNMPAQKIELKKMVDTTAPAAGGPAPVTADTLAKATEESVTVPAGTFKAKVIEMNMDQQGMTIKSKTWFCEDVPGGVVKMEATTDGAVKSSTKGELTVLDKK